MVYMILSINWVKKISCSFLGEKDKLYNCTLARQQVHMIVSDDGVIIILCVLCVMQGDLDIN